MIFAASRFKCFIQIMSRWFEEVYGSTITVSIVGNLVVLLRFRDFACVFFTFGAALHHVIYGKLPRTTPLQCSFIALNLPIIIIYFSEPRNYRYLGATSRTHFTTESRNGLSSITTSGIFSDYVRLLRPPLCRRRLLLLWAQKA